MVQTQPRSQRTFLIYLLPFLIPPYPCHCPPPYPLPSGKAPLCFTYLCLTLQSSIGCKLRSTLIWYIDNFRKLINTTAPPSSPPCNQVTLPKCYILHTCVWDWEVVLVVDWVVPWLGILMISGNSSMPCEFSGDASDWPSGESSSFQACLIGPRGVSPCRKNQQRIYKLSNPTSLDRCQLLTNFCDCVITKGYIQMTIHIYKHPDSSWPAT